ncbi:PAS domain S-box protein [Mesorhizobium sp. NZP2077]|nr:PAS domain S-box protein [Mesorhizobium sp. NZP2077]QKD19216.1 PAS domain S-box protein [Mesorhizobium sp. NZP2077]
MMITSRTSFPALHEAFHRFHRALMQLARNVEPFVKPWRSLSIPSGSSHEYHDGSPSGRFSQSAFGVFEDLADHALVGMTIVLDARFVYANQKCWELFGYSEEEFIQLSPFDLVVDTDKEMVRNRMNERLRSETTNSEYSCRGVRKDGSIIDLEVRGTTIAIDGRPALATSFVEMTDTRRAIQEGDHQRATRDKVKRALESAGVEFIPENGGGAGVRLKKP